MVALTYHPSYAEAINRRTEIQDRSLGQKCKTLFKDNKSKKGLGAWLEQ
jgi:hypothetical protein